MIIYIHGPTSLEMMIRFGATTSFYCQSSVRYSGISSVGLQMGYSITVDQWDPSWDIWYILVYLCEFLINVLLLSLLSLLSLLFFYHVYYYYHYYYFHIIIFYYYSIYMLFILILLLSLLLLYNYYFQHYAYNHYIYIACIFIYNII